MSPQSSIKSPVADHSFVPALARIWRLVVQIKATIRSCSEGFWWRVQILAEVEVGMCSEFPPMSPQSSIKSPVADHSFVLALAGIRRLVVQLKATI